MFSQQLDFPPAKYILYGCTATLTQETRNTTYTKTLQLQLLQVLDYAGTWRLGHMVSVPDIQCTVS